VKPSRPTPRSAGTLANPCRGHVGFATRRLEILSIGFFRTPAFPGSGYSPKDLLNEQTTSARKNQPASGPA
jgi:hypothetical protein